MNVLRLPLTGLITTAAYVLLKLGFMGFATVELDEMADDVDLVVKRSQ
jgi:hypothetical protein